MELNCHKSNEPTHLVQLEVEYKWARNRIRHTVGAQVRPSRVMYERTRDALKGRATKEWSRLNPKVRKKSATVRGWIVSDSEVIRQRGTTRICYTYRMRNRCFWAQCRKVYNVGGGITATQLTHLFYRANRMPWTEIFYYRITWPSADANWLRRLPRVFLV